MEKYIKKRPFLFWSTNSYSNISPAVVVENILNYGDFDDFNELVKIMGIKKMAKIFEKQNKQKRKNYRPEIANYFKLYFDKYAH